MQIKIFIFIMTLAQYYHAADANKSNIYSTEGIGSLRESISEFFKGFDEAIKQDCVAEGKSIVCALNLSNAYITNAYLTKNRDSLLGLALYLLDFRGFNDEILKEGKFDINSLMHMVFTYGYAFEEAHFRLLEITRCHRYAVMQPQRDNVAYYILANLDEYSEAELNEVLNKLKKMKTKVEKNGLKFSDYTAPYLLYKVINAKHSVFSKW